MDETVGRREQHKRETRASLREAAVGLFRERGYQATTVREIADAAGVTERTFYRYFDGKEELLAEEARAWMERLQEAIRRRPVREPPLLAVRRAVLALVKEAAAEGGPPSFGPFSGDRRPFELLRRATPRPLLRFENAIAAALAARMSGKDHGSLDVETEFLAQIYARVAVAALRSAVIRHRELDERGDRAPGIARLITEAFAAIERPSASR